MASLESRTLNTSSCFLGVPGTSSKAKDSIVQTSNAEKKRKEIKKKSKESIHKRVRKLVLTIKKLRHISPVGWESSLISFFKTCNLFYDCVCALANLKYKLDLRHILTPNVIQRFVTYMQGPHFLYFNSYFTNRFYDLEVAVMEVSSFLFVISVNRDIKEVIYMIHTPSWRFPDTETGGWY